MKKTFFALFLISFLITSAFAQKVHVTPEIQKAFRSAFTGASDVKWSIADNLHKAEFISSGLKMTAFFNEEGSLVACTRPLTYTQLPLLLQISLNKSAAGGQVTELMEVNNEEGSHYYALVQYEAKRRVLKSFGSAEWTVYRRK